MKKIIILSKYYPPKIDGVGDHTFCLQKSLNNLGYNCKVIHEDDELPFEKKNLDKLIHRINEEQAEYILFQYVGYSYSRIGAPFWLIKLLKELKKNKKTKIVLFVHETYVRSSGSLKNKFYHFLQKLCLRYLCGNSDLILCNLNFYQAQVDKLGYKSILCPTPSNFEFTLKKNKQTKAEIKHKISSFGNRNYSYSLEVLNQLLLRGIKFEFHIWGQINDYNLAIIKNHKNKKLLERIKLMGNKEDYEIIEGLNSSTLFLFPEFVSNKGEGGLNTKSGTTATAFMLGLPVVSTWGDMSDKNIFKDQKNCIIITPNNSIEAANNIENYINRPDKLFRIGNNAQEMYYNKLGWKNLISNLNSSLNAIAR